MSNEAAGHATPVFRYELQSLGNIWSSLSDPRCSGVDSVKFMRSMSSVWWLSQRNIGSTSSLTQRCPCWSLSLMLNGVKSNQKHLHGKTELDTWQGTKQRTQQTAKGAQSVQRLHNTTQDAHPNTQSRHQDIWLNPIETLQRSCLPQSAQMGVDAPHLHLLWRPCMLWTCNLLGYRVPCCFFGWWALGGSVWERHEEEHSCCYGRAFEEANTKHRGKKISSFSCFPETADKISRQGLRGFSEFLGRTPARRSGKSVEVTKGWIGPAVGVNTLQERCKRIDPKEKCNRSGRVWGVLKRRRRWDGT